MVCWCLSLVVYNLESWEPRVCPSWTYLHGRNGMQWLIDEFLDSWRNCPQEAICTSNSNFAHDKWAGKIHIQIEGLPITVYFFQELWRWQFLRVQLLKLWHNLCTSMGPKPFLYDSYRLMLSHFNYGWFIWIWCLWLSMACFLEFEYPQVSITYIYIGHKTLWHDETSSCSDWLQRPIEVSLAGSGLWWIAAIEDVHSGVPPWATSQCRYGHLVCLNNAYQRVGWRKYHLCWS